MGVRRSVTRRRPGGFLAAVLLLAALLAGDALGGGGTMTAVAWRRMEAGVAIAVTIEGSIAEYRSFVLDDPPRLVVDLPGLRSRFSGPQQTEVGASGVWRVRHFAHADKVRLVIDIASRPASGHVVKRTPEGLEVLVSGSGAEDSRVAAAAAETAPKKTPDAAKSAAQGEGGILEEVEAGFVDGQVVIHLRAKGAIEEPRMLTADNPPRLVFDIPNLRAPYSGERRIPVRGAKGREVRLLPRPEGMRVMVETERKNREKSSVIRTETGLVLAVGEAEATGRALAPPPPAPAASGQTARPAAERPTAREAAAAALVDRVLEPEDPGTFEIKRFEVSGNTVLSPMVVENTLSPFTGRRRKAEDVEKARDALEKRYHERGYPTVLVNIPEQSVEGGAVRLEVIESRIGRVRVNGNRYFTMEKILKELPSLGEGMILYLPRVQEDLAQINRNPDIKVAPVLAPGSEPGTIDVELNVKDRLPLHGSLEVNNRNTHDTTDLRLNAQLRYDNLWQRDHSVSLQWQTSPLDTGEVFALAGSYVLPAPWGRDNLLALYGLYTDSNTAFGAGFQTIGKGWVAGFRNVFPLPAAGPYAHNLSAGFDYKSFEDRLNLEGEEANKTTVRYFPLSLAYSASLRDGFGVTQFSSGINLSFRGLVAEQEKFQEKRFESRGNYLYLTGGLERNQALPYGLGVFGKIAAQIADQPLISNEQFLAGGMKSVRGYKETEASGDDGLLATLEFSAPDLVSLTPWHERANLTPFVFQDFAWLKLKEPLPRQERTVDLHGTGVGLRGQVAGHLDFEIAWGMALAKTDRTERGDSDLYFLLKGQF